MPSSQLESIFNTFPDGVIACDREDKIIRINAAALKLFGVASESFYRGTSYHQFLHSHKIGDEQPGAISLEPWLLSLVLEGEAATWLQQEHLVLWTHVGRKIYVNVRRLSVRDAQEHDVARVYVFHDITSRYRKVLHLQRVQQAISTLKEAIVRIPERKVLCRTQGHQRAKFRSFCGIIPVSEVLIMSEAVSSNQSRVSGRSWLDLTKRILVGVIMCFAVVGLIVNLASLAGVWIARAPASAGVTDVTATATHALGIVDNGLTRVNTLVQNARQTVTQVNNKAAQLGDRVQANSPVVASLSQLVDNALAPRIENARTNSSTIHDAVLTVSSLLMVLNRIPSVTVPSLSAQLGSVSVRAQEAQAAVQDLRATLAGMKAGLASKAEAAVTQLTSRIDAALARLQAIVNKYQATVAQTLARITSTSNRILLLINVLAVSLTLLSLIFAAGLVLLTYVCWQYVRTAQFPSLRVMPPRSQSK